jgi:tight adherence protein B
VTGLFSIVLGAAAGGMLAVGVREALAASPAAAAWLLGAVEPLRRAGSEGYAPSEAERRRLAWVGSGLFLAVALLLAGPGPLAVLAAAGPGAAGWAVNRRRARYRRAVERLMPEIATAVADALAAGRSVRGALASAGDSLEGPAAAEMARLAADLSLGVPTREALEGLGRRLESERVEVFRAAMLSQQLAGGDLSTLLRRYAAATAERRRVAEDARAATAQARFTGLLVVALPGGAALFAELLEPGFAARLLSSGPALAMLALAAAFQGAGFLVIRRLGRARV